MKMLKAAARALYALGETTLVYVALLCLMGALFNQSWREWVDAAAWARAAPSALAVLCLLALFRLTRKRYALSSRLAHPSDRPQRVTWWFAAVLLSTAPVVLVMGVHRFQEPGALQLITISASIASLFNVLCIALTEEFVYRYALMGRLLHLGVPVLISLVIQAGLFLAAHGKHAFIAPHTVAWYLVGGLTLGTLYVATRSISCTVALHAIVDICIAQTGPASYWLTHRPVEAMRYDWTIAATGLWSIALLVYWSYARRSNSTSRYDLPGKRAAGLLP